MTEREKMIEVIAPYVSAWGDDERIADALIKVGIGDVSKWETLCKVLHEQMMENMREERHRAEVAEKMFDILYEETSEYMKVLSKEWYKYQAEKELAEGKKE